MNELFWWRMWEAVFFFGHKPKWFWNDRKNVSHFGQNVWKHRLKNTVEASFNITVRQMTEMFQWPNFLSKNDRNVSKQVGSMANLRNTVVWPTFAGCTVMLSLILIKKHQVFVWSEKPWRKQDTASAFLRCFERQKRSLNYLSVSQTAVTAHCIATPKIL